MGDIYHGLHDIVVETTEEDLADVAKGMAQ
jgi:hypothetical protein